MENPVKLKIYGIKCDSCDFKDMTVEVQDYPKWLNKSCPNCGENLLTEADYKNAIFLMKITEVANSFLPKIESEKDPVAITVKMDGTGKMDFELKQ